MVISALFIEMINKPIPEVTMDVAGQPATALLLDSEHMPGRDGGATSVSIIPTLPRTTGPVATGDASLRAPIPANLVGTRTAAIFGDIAQSVHHNRAPPRPLFLGPVATPTGVVGLDYTAHRAHHDYGCGADDK